MRFDVIRGKPGIAENFPGDTSGGCGGVPECRRNAPDAVSTPNKVVRNVKKIPTKGASICSESLRMVAGVFKKVARMFKKNVAEVSGALKNVAGAFGWDARMLRPGSKGFTGMFKNHAGKLRKVARSREGLRPRRNVTYTPAHGGANGEHSQSLHTIGRWAI